MSNKQFTYVLTDNTITLYLNGETYTADAKNPNYKKILKSIKKGIRSESKSEKLITYFDLKKAITIYLDGVISVSEDGVLKYKDKIIDNVLTKKILNMMRQGFNIEPMIQFLANLKENPSHTAQEELMLFMEANDMPLTEDGYILAYKSVNAQYRDIHSNTFDNSIGAINFMDRGEVDDDRATTCSTGLHAASKEYASIFGRNDSHLIVLKINPRDIVSIPLDYGNQKLRCCKYLVIDEVPRTMKNNGYDTTAII